MSNLLPLAAYQAQRDMVRASLMAGHPDVYATRGPKPGLVVRPLSHAEYLMLKARKGGTR
jgi:hypothetical protein